jgi:hypothetical protein
LGPLASLTRVDACNPPTASAPDLGAGRTRRPRDFHLSHARLRPPRLSPLRARPRARPIWAGARSTLTRRLRDPPVSKRRQQATPWPPSYKPPQLPMYDGHSDPKQFLMNYEATISSYGGNTAVMAKSFVMAVKSVAQTWYSSLRPGTITSWQKLKDMLVTRFQGFKTKPVTAQALFQCTQDHEEYLQAYVRRFLRLRAQAHTVPNEIVIEAMIKGLRLGPIAQYFARKPPQTLKKLLQKMDEYIQVDNDFRQRREEAYMFSQMARGFGGRLHPRHVRSIHNANPSDDRGSQPQRQQHSSQSSGPQQSSFRPPAPRGRGGRSFGGRYRDQPRRLFSYSAVKTKATTQEHAKLQFRSKKRLPKLRHDRISRSRSYILLHAIFPMS